MFHFLGFASLLALSTLSTLAGNPVAAPASLDWGHRGQPGAQGATQGAPAGCRAAAGGESRLHALLQELALLAQPAGNNSGMFFLTLVRLLDLAYMGKSKQPVGTSPSQWAKRSLSALNQYSLSQTRNWRPASKSSRFYLDKLLYAFFFWGGAFGINLESLKWCLF